MYDSPLDPHEEFRNSTLLLKRVSPDEQARLVPVLARYLMEIAPSAGIDPAKKSRRALNRDDHHVVWISTQNNKIGFAIILTLPEGQKELSDFTIFPEHRRQGFGQKAAQKVFTAMPGVWRMGVSGSSPEAEAFWGTCLSVTPEVSDVKTGAPFSTGQRKSYSFHVARQP